MIVLPEFDPVALQLGPLAIRWYGLAYLIGIVGAIFLGRMRARKPFSPIPRPVVLDLVLYCALGAIIGGRLGYVVFYNILEYVQNPIAILKIWQGGMSFHGGLIGAIAGVWVFGRKFTIPLLKLTDFLAPLCAVGLFFGRIANFVNQELWGRPTDVSWGMVFPADSLQVARHPSQLYEAALEGAALFLILWIYSAKPRAVGAVSGMFLIGYGVFRLFVEFFREPDLIPGFVIGNWGTMGHVLSIPLVVGGLALLYLASREEKHE